MRPATIARVLAAVLVSSGCAAYAPATDRVPATPTPAPLSQAQVISGVCTALDNGDSHRAVVLLGDRPVAPILAGMSQVCPQQVERMRQAADDAGAP